MTTVDLLKQRKLEAESKEAQRVHHEQRHQNEIAAMDEAIQIAEQQALISAASNSVAVAADSGRTLTKRNAAVIALLRAPL